MVEAEAELHRVPQVREVFRRHGHREGDGDVQRAAALDGAAAHLAEVAAAECALCGFLHAVELQVELEFSRVEGSPERGEEGIVVRDAHAVGVQQHVVNAGVRVEPREQLEELRMQRGLAAGELEDFDAALAVNHALDAPLHVGERHGVERARGRIRVARGAGEVAGVHDFDQREAGAQALHRVRFLNRGGRGGRGGKRRAR